MNLEGVQRSHRADGKWQIVPYPSCSDTKCSVADGEASCTWHEQLVGDWRSQTLSGVVVSASAQCRSLARWQTYWL